MTTKPPTENELREWERLAEDAEVEGPDHLSGALPRFLDAARTGWPRTIAALREAQAEIERLKSNERYDAARINDFETTWASPDNMRAKDQEIEELRRRLLPIDAPHLPNADLIRLSRALGLPEPICEECEAKILRPKCLWDFGAACPRHKQRRDWEVAIAAKGTKP